jgi:radical SAM protein with 4Fe4S-binding SPASM domain
MLEASRSQHMSASSDPPASRPSPVRLPLLPPKPSASHPLAGEVRQVDRVRPIYAVWEITRRCDLACHHCGTRAGHARSDELDTEECLDLVAQMAALGIKEVTLIGGEAYLRPDWLTILAAVCAHGMDVSMTTGGRGITRERAEQAVAAGLQSAAVSLDGMEATHDRQRALDGSFRAAVRALGYLREAGVPVSVNTQVNAWSWRELPELLEVLIEQHAHAWQLQLTVPMGRAADRPEILLQPYQLLEVLPLIAGLHPRAAAKGVRIFPGNNVGYFGPHEPLLRRYMPEQHRGSCGAGKVVLGLEANGTVKGCPSLPTAEWAGGSVREHSLEQLWERSAPIRYTRDRTLDDLWGYCRECYYAAECMGGCTWMAHGLFGKPGNNPYCHHRALEMQRAGWRERVVLRERAPGEPFDHGVFELVREPFASDPLEPAAAGV